MDITLVILGLILGSFINAWVWRVKKGMSVASGRSMCPHCRHELAWSDLIPVFSWLALRGKCRYCKKPISVQYPVVELLTGGLFWLSGEFWPRHLESSTEYIYFALWLAALVCLIAMVVYDLKWLIMPDLMNALFALFGLAGVAVLGTMDPEIVADRVAGVLIAGGFFTLLLIVSKGRWIGGGDVKFAYGMGVWLGASKAVVGVLLSFYAAAILIIPLLLIGKVSRKQAVPFGPFLALGTIAAMLWGDALAEWYMTLFQT